MHPTKLAALLLLVAPSAVSAPNFPLTFKGAACDMLNGRCSEVVMTFDADGLVQELTSGLEGTYTWQDQMLMMEFPRVGMMAMLHKDPASPCVAGEWWMENGHTGSMELCRG